MMISYCTLCELSSQPVTLIYKNHIFSRDPSHVSKMFIYLKTIVKKPKGSSLTFRNDKEKYEILTFRKLEMTTVC